MPKRRYEESPTSTLTIRIDSELKEVSSEVLEGMGLNLTSGITIFLKAVAREGKIPFDVVSDSKTRLK